MTRVWLRPEGGDGIRVRGRSGGAIVTDRFTWLAVTVLVLIVAISIAVYLVAARHD